MFKLLTDKINKYKNQSNSASYSSIIDAFLTTDFIQHTVTEPIMTADEQYHDAINKFIEMANQLKNEKYPTEVISSALMTASGVYATYVAADERNNGFLLEPGVEKVTDAYRERLQIIQDSKKKEAEDAGLRPKDTDAKPAND
jgi:hypothetical protein